MGVKKLQSLFPEWYKEWLYKSLSLKDGEEISQTILEPLYSLNKNWLKENYNQQEYAWDSSQVARSYALYYMTINIPKLWMTLSNSNQWEQKCLSEVKTVSEFGSGPGTFLFSYLFYLYSQHPEALKSLEKITAVDISEEHLKVAKSLFENLKNIEGFEHINAEFIHAGWIDEFTNHSADLNIFGNSLIESGIDDKILENKGLKNILIIEPGTKEHFTRLKNLKGKFQQHDWHTHFPCPTDGKCPMSEDNWCHFRINRFMLPFIQRMSAAAGRRNHNHNFTSFLISKHNNDYNEENWRVLSSNRKVKRTSIRYICNGKRMIEAVLNRKERSELNSDFINCETGCCCYSSGEFRQSRLKAADSFTEC